MIDTQEKLIAHLQRERDVYQTALRLMEDGKLTSHSNNVDTTRFDIANLEGIVANISEVLERMGAD